MQILIIIQLIILYKTSGTKTVKPLFREPGKDIKTEQDYTKSFIGLENKKNLPANTINIPVNPRNLQALGWSHKKCSSTARE
jgi:hypothetical protein